MLHCSSLVIITIFLSVGIRCSLLSFVVVVVVAAFFVLLRIPNSHSVAYRWSSLSDFGAQLWGFVWPSRISAGCWLDLVPSKAPGMICSSWLPEMSSPERPFQPKKDDGSDTVSAHTHVRPFCNNLCPCCRQRWTRLGLNEVRDELRVTLAAKTALIVFDWSYL